jgi:retinol dehydrogenase 12
MIIMNVIENSITCFVTGVTSGIGRALALELARRGHRVILCARDAVTGNVFQDQLRVSAGTQNTRLVCGDLTQMSDVRQIATTLSDESLDVIVHNAAIVKQRREVTADGLEVTFATNHLAPFLLTDLLLSRRKLGRPVRLITVSSSQHKRVTSIPWDDIQLHRSYDPGRAYMLTKLYNVLFTMEVAKRYGRDGVTALAFDPGFVRTLLGREATGLQKALLWVTRPIQRDPASAACELADLVVLPKIENGCYVVGTRIEPPSPLATDKAAVRLWELTQALISTSNMRT